MDDFAAFKTYLNDHLAGSVGALELVEHLTRNHAGTPLEKFFAELYRDISSDQDVLRDLLHTLGIEESTVRQAGAWIAEKLSRVKLGLTENQVRGPGLLQALEGLIMGISGKEMLWRALAVAAEVYPPLQGLDYAKLEQRAVDQRDRVEEKRLDAARDSVRSS